MTTHTQGMQEKDRAFFALKYNKKDNMKDEIKNKVIRELTDVTPRELAKILRMMEELQNALYDLGCGVFCGGCNDDAVLVHEETGIKLGGVHGYGVWMGGDWNEKQSVLGIDYNEDVSSTAGNFDKSGA